MLLSVDNLRVAFRMGERQVQRVEAVGAARGVGFEVPENTTVALVGESGSGKSVTAMSIMQPAARQRRAQRPHHVPRPRPARASGAELRRAARARDRLRVPGADDAR